MIFGNIELIEDFLDMVKEALPTPQKDLKKTQVKELELWHHWNENGRKPDHLKPLLDSYKPLLEQKARQQGKNRVELPTSAIEAEYKKHFVNAVKTYDPKRGTQLNTWVQQNIMKASRYIKTYQNLGKIPEPQIAKINEFKQAKESLGNTLGYEPDSKTLADHLGWTQKKVIQMTKELRRDLPVSGFAHGEDPATTYGPKEMEAIRLMQYDLAPEERTIYEYTFGVNGKSYLLPGQIAKVTGIHASKVSRVRAKLADKLHETIQLVS